MTTRTLVIPCSSENNDFIPKYATSGSAGADVYANVGEDLVVPPGTSALIPTGLRWEIPEGFEIQLRPRSGLALKHGITLLNSPGTIDSDYRGEVGVIIINHSNQDFVVTPGMKIAQMVLCQVYQAEFAPCESAILASSDRGEGGFGHTGLH